MPAKGRVQGLRFPGCRQVDGTAGLGMPAAGTRAVRPQRPPAPQWQVSKPQPGGAGEARSSPRRHRAEARGPFSNTLQKENVHKG